MGKLTTTILKEAANCFSQARKNVYQGAEFLYQIQKHAMWEGSYSSFNEYVETECQLSKSYASKLIQVWTFYVIEGGLPQKDLLEIDAEKLYLSTKLPRGSVEQRLVRAREWSRDDMRAELASDEHGDCRHPKDKRVVLCGVCGRRLQE